MPKRHRHRRSGSPESDFIGRAVVTASFLGSKGCLVLGASLFSLFWWLLPTIVGHHQADLADSQYFPLLQPFFENRRKSLKLAAILALVICVAFAAKNYRTEQRMKELDIEATSFIAKLLSMIF